jgi:hypothetical protein
MNQCLKRPSPEESETLYERLILHLLCLELAVWWFPGSFDLLSSDDASPPKNVDWLVHDGCAWRWSLSIRQHHLRLWIFTNLLV